MKPGQARIIVLLLVLLVLELLIHPGVKTFISGTYQKINSLLQGSTGNNSVQVPGSSLTAPGGIQGNVVSSQPGATPQNRKMGQGYAPR